MLRVRVEYAVFSRYDLQPPLTFTYALDGSTVRIGMNALICSASCAPRRDAARREEPGRLEPGRLEEIAARAKSAGITLKAEPHDTDLKSRAFEVTDPSGYLLTVSSEVSSWT